MGKGRAQMKCIGEMLKDIHHFSLTTSPPDVFWNIGHGHIGGKLWDALNVHMRGRLKTCLLEEMQGGSDER